MVIPTSHKAVESGPLWMQCPNIEEDEIIPGLAYIYPLDQLIVAKKRDNLHDIIGKKGIAYTVFNSGGQKVFLAVLKKRFRNFNVKIFNNYGNEVINVEKPFNLCDNKVLVWGPPGNFLGSIHEHPSCIGTYTIKDERGLKVLKIRAEGICQYVYKIYLVSYGGRPIGVVRDQFPVPNMKNFGVSFPKEIDVKDKAVLLGACFLIGCFKY